jgi:capsular polysaccharide biosynthesis protein
MEDESSFIDELKKRNFIILNDTVTPQLERMYYIQNAELIVGIHGTLMKHSVWCRKNPLCIEFTQSLNHCIRENALGFKTMYFGTNEKQQSAFFRIIDTLFPSLF